MGGGSYVKTGKDEDESTTVIFCLPEGVGVLADALKIFHVSYTLLFPIVYVWVTNPLFDKCKEEVEANYD